MLFHVKMTVNLPVDMNPEAAAKLKADEKALAQAAQKLGEKMYAQQQAEGAAAGAGTFIRGSV